MLGKKTRLETTTNLSGSVELDRAPAQLYNHQLKYFIGPGNNCGVVRNVMKQRYWWQPATREDLHEASFVWTQWKQERHFEYLRTVAPRRSLPRFYAKIDKNYHLANKNSLLMNMVAYYRSKGKDPFEVLPETYLVSGISDVQFTQFSTLF